MQHTLTRQSLESLRLSSTYSYIITSKIKQEEFSFNGSGSVYRVRPCTTLDQLSDFYGYYMQVSETSSYQPTMEDLMVRFYEYRSLSRAITKRRQRFIAYLII
ncbi:hypothetical protein EYR41_010762 [Orbilia oligospora]|uniref:Uncharacterized protein n=1 Tax=Orbilia oligospora TaxID=2813651 RepID=A0A8H2DTK3_ORBOL|nr:hypothetical protein EYR41_010762 [Orbilia oligospora]